jgi:hypothetical protein
MWKVHSIEFELQQAIRIPRVWEVVSSTTKIYAELYGDIKNYRIKSL